MSWNIFRCFESERTSRMRALESNAHLDTVSLAAQVGRAKQLMREDARHRLGAADSTTGLRWGVSYGGRLPWQNGFFFVICIENQTPEFQQIVLWRLNLESGGYVTPMPAPEHLRNTLPWFWHPPLVSLPPGQVQTGSVFFRLEKHRAKAVEALTDVGQLMATSLDGGRLVQRVEVLKLQEHHPSAEIRNEAEIDLTCALNVDSIGQS